MIYNVKFVAGILTIGSQWCSNRVVRVDTKEAAHTYLVNAGFKVIRTYGGGGVDGIYVRVASVL